MSPDARPDDPAQAANQPPAEPSRERREGPRPMWSGAITFGLVTVPVELHSAVRSVRPRTRLLGPDGTPLQRRYRCPTHDRVLDDDEIVRGYPIGRDQLVVLTDAELDALAPERSGEICVQHFVEHDALPLPLVERTLYMAPRPGNARAYRLLTTVMERAGLAAIATFVMRGHEHLAALVAEDGVLRAELLRLPDELRTPDDVGLPPAPPRIDPARLEATRAALRPLYADSIDLAALHDEREDELQRLAEDQLARGEGVVAAPEPSQEGIEQELREHVVDLMQVLRQRIAEDDAHPPAA